MSEATPVVLTHTPVELFKILKFEGIVASGAEAKQIISEGLVKVNGEIELRKRRQILVGDQIEIPPYHLVMVSELS